MKALLLIVAVLSVFFVGCAHKRASSSIQGSMDVSHSQDQKAQPPASDQTIQQQDEEHEFWADDFENLDEEDSEEAIEIADPFLYWNKAMYHFNDKLYFWLLKPVARGYRWVTPEFVRTGVKNFFHNITFHVRFVSCILQAKGRAAQAEFAKFFFNTTFGVLGFGNPARNYSHLDVSEEDLGQAFGKWGIGEGFYIIWPILGPSTLRDSVGLAGEFFLDPISYVDPSEASLGLTAYDSVNATSFRIGDYEALKKAAFDPYVSLRNAYVQDRQNKVRE
ncbi:MAG: VacJ family lipoprotein [Deltaproteobacteria bacterium]|nr:VacJ family lipoprotein [Deltaproteobacteria bacterium]